MLLANYYDSWLSKCKSVYKNGGWTPNWYVTFVSNDAIPGTSLLPSIGFNTDVKPTPQAQAKKKRGFMDIIKGTTSSDEPTSAHSPPLKVLLPRSGSDSGSKHSHSRSGSDSDTLVVKKPEDLQSKSVTKTVPVFNMEIPTLSDTLVCARLRRHFYTTFLESRLGNDEKKLWTALSEFQEAYQSLSDEEVCQRQKDIRDAAMTILKNNSSIPDRDNLMDIIEKEKYNVSSKFFLGVEMKIYQDLHKSYQSFLESNLKEGKN